MLTFVLTYASSPSTSVLAFTITVALLLTIFSYTGQLYNAPTKFNLRFLPEKISFRSILDASFLLNLVVVGVGVHYAADDTNAKTAVVYTSVIIAFLKFIGIVVYHFWCAMRKYVSNTSCRYRNLDSTHDAINSITSPTIKTISQNQYSQFREPLFTELTM